MARITNTIIFCAAGMALAGSGCSDRQEQAHARLHERKAEFSVDGFLKAAGEGDAEKVRVYVEAGMDKDAANERGETALLAAARRGHGHVVQYLLELGAEVNRANSEGEIALSAAARQGDPLSVEALIKCGADAERQDGRGLTALGEAALNGHAEAVRILAPRSRPSLNYALQLAAVKGRPDVVEALLAAGADPHSRSIEHKTPLMYAATHGRADAVRLLLDHAANPLDLDRSGKSAAMFAQENGYDEIASLLLQPIPAEGDLEQGMTEEDFAEPESISQAPPEYAPGDAPAMEPGDETPIGSETTSDGQVVRTGALPNLDEVPQPHGIQPNPDEPVSPADIPDASMAAQGEIPAQEVVALAGAKLQALPGDGASRLTTAFKLEDYRQRQLPLVVRSVAENKAVMQMLNGEQQEISLAAGDSIPDMKLEVVSIKRQSVVTKLGRGELADVSSVVLRDTETGEKFLARVNEPVMSSDTLALIRLARNGRLHEARSGDQFQVGDEQFEVIDLRPTQVVLESAATGETVVITR